MPSHRVLVAHSSKHGATAEIAEWVAGSLRGQGLDVDLRDVDHVDDISAYGALVIGGALYMGRWYKPARRFVRHIRRDVAGTPVWLFSSGPIDESAARCDLPPARGVRRAMQRLDARGHATFGGRLGESPREAIARAVAKQHHGDFRDRAQVEAWAGTIAAELIALGFHSEPLVDGGRS